MGVENILRAIVPTTTRPWLHKQSLAFGRLLRRVGVNPGQSLLRRTTPINPNDYGESRGQCIDRYYIENFLAAHAQDVRGHVLDFADDTYARKYGGDKATKIDVLDLSPDNVQATIIADLANGENIPSDTFDCILCTQVLHCIFDVEAAIRTLYRILKPGGVLLVTDACIQKVDSVDLRNEEEFWRFTSLGLHRMFEKVFPRDQLEVQAYGNVLVAIAALHGLAVEDVTRKSLDVVDQDFEVLLSLRAVKPMAGETPEVRAIANSASHSRD
jgi:SAM-dependent methyltransferase